MNQLARSVLTCYSYDDNADDTSVSNVLRQSIELIARLPTLAAYGFQAKEYFLTIIASIFINPGKILLLRKIFTHDPAR